MKPSFLPFIWAIACISLGLWDFFLPLPFYNQIIWTIPMSLGFVGRNLALLELVLGIIAYYWTTQKQSA